MKILQINNYGYVRGGSDRYFIDLGNLLTSKGNKVSYLVSANEKNIVDSRFVTKGFPLESPSAADIPAFFYSPSAKKQLRRLIEQEKPDIAHLHIYYGQITASILPVLKEMGIPVVQTLHEYKLLCPVSTMTSNGQYCDACSRHGLWCCIWNRCNRGSLLRSAVVAAESCFASILGAQSQIDHFIAVSDFVRNTMINHGIPESRISTVHNFVRPEVFAENTQEGKYFLFFGRIEKIKGVETLIKATAALPHIDLYIAGSGDASIEMQQLAKNLGANNIHFSGFQSGNALRELVAGSIAVITPSEWNETFGLVLVESFAQSRPVIASRIGGMTEVVSDGKDGILIEPGDIDALKDAMSWMESHRQDAVLMGKYGQNKANSIFSPENHYHHIMQIYKKAVTACKNAKKSYL